MVAVIQDPRLAWRRITDNVNALVRWAQRKGTEEDCAGLREAADAINAFGERFGFSLPPNLDVIIRPIPEKQSASDRPIPIDVKGQSAYRQGLPYEANPYELGTPQFFEWREGWLRGQAAGIKN